MHDVLKKVSEIGIVPVIKIDDAEKAVPLAKALADGGIPCAEITFRTAQGEEAIRRVSAEMPEVLVGAGTVTTTEQVDKAIAAGAKFVVSPGFNPKVVAYCIEKSITITPGCSSPSDIEQAISFGLDVVKFFPAEQAGGLEYIKAVSAPYPGIKFMPTGGINASNICKYLAFDKIIACGGSWMVGADLIESGNFAEITRLSKQAVQTIMGFELAHIGMNTESDAEAREAAKMFELLFGFGVHKDNDKSIWAGDNIEVMKLPLRGKHGHIAIGTSNVPRAKAYLERTIGMTFIPGTEKISDKGELTFIYLDKEIAGFAVHLIKIVK